MKITYCFIFSLLFFFLLNINAKASPCDSVNPVSKENLCKNWVLKEYKENGKTQSLYEYEIELFANGKYVETEEEETEKGTWELNENNTAIVFDKNTLDQDEWIIETLEPGKFVIKFSDDDKNYRFIMIPAK